MRTTSIMMIVGLIISILIIPAIKAGFSENQLSFMIVAGFGSIIFGGLIQYFNNLNE